MPLIFLRQFQQLSYRVYLISFFISESGQSAPVSIPGKTTDAQVCILAYQIVSSIMHLTIVLDKDASTVMAVKLIVWVKILLTSNNLFRAVSKGR